MIIPMLTCADGAAEIEFCKAAFDAVELSRRTGHDGEVVHATLKIDEDMFMDALDTSPARRPSDRTNPHHSDHGVQYFDPWMS